MKNKEGIFDCLLVHPFVHSSTSRFCRPGMGPKRTEMGSMRLEMEPMRPMLEPHVPELGPQKPVGVLGA